MPEIKKVLVVDDTPIIRRFLCEVLESEGYEFDEAHDGEEAISKIKSDNYDLVICDIHMPRKNGFETFVEARKIDPSICFVMTDSLPDKLAEKTNEMGAMCCLAKPFELDELKKTLKQAEKLVNAQENPGGRKTIKKV